jgi:tRNA(Ser,Leu) C12 N-acetylase TAN1
MEVVETMKDGRFSATSAASLYDECKIIWSGFQEISIEHCNRDANQVAHELEKEPCNLSKIILGTMSPLAFFLNFLINNVTTLNE